MAGATMRAVVTSGPGGPEVMSIGEVPRPEPKANEVLIRVCATGINRAELHQRSGNYPVPPGDSDILGLEASGRIEALGAGVEGWAKGDRVMGLVKGGGYAEFAIADAGALMRVPDTIGLVEAGGIAEVFLTAHLNLFGEGALKDGETALIHGGASGVGTAGIQLVTALRPKSRVFVTVGSEAKATSCLDLGAEAAILYKREDFSEGVQALTGDNGADVILDHIGPSYLAKNLACLAVYGRLVVIGQLGGGGEPTLPLGRLMGKRQRIIGSVLRARPIAEKARITKAFADDALELLASGKLRVIVHEVLPLAEVRKAHELVEANANTGKVILEVDGGLV